VWVKTDVISEIASTETVDEDFRCREEDERVGRSQGMREAI